MSERQWPPQYPWGDTPPPRGVLEFFSGLWRAGRDTADKKKQVVDAVRIARAGKTRDQLRSLFAKELARHEVPPDPIWVERQLDELESSPGERARRTGEDLLSVGGALLRMARAGGVSDAPKWMEPPEDAIHPQWGPTREKTAVDLDPQASSWLERVLAGAPVRVGDLLAPVEVWFEVERSANADPQVAVHLGSETVGMFDSRALQGVTATTRSVEKQRARFRARGQLTRAAHMQPPYLLVVEVPVDGPS
jgi:hypothetical protein